MSEPGVEPGSFESWKAALKEGTAVPAENFAGDRGYLRYDPESEVYFWLGGEGKDQPLTEQDAMGIIGLQQRIQGGG